MQKQRGWSSLLCVLVGVVLISNLGCSKKNDTTKELIARLETTAEKMEETASRMETAIKKLERLTQKESDETTIITASLEQEIPPGKNVIWCATLQLAWNELCKLAGGSIMMEDEAPLVALLNQQTAANLDLDADSYLAVAGSDKDVLAAIANIPKQFGGRDFRGDLGDIPPGSIAAYAYLFKTLPFEWAFTRFTSPLQYGETGVASFGIGQYMESETEQKIASQVLILSYNTNDDFIVELMTASQTDRLILAKVAAEPTLGATVTAILDKIADSTPTMLQKLENLVIPVVDFDRMQAYPELTGRKIIAVNPQVNGKSIGAVVQRTRFTLDETGAILESKALMASAPSPRQFVFNAPFAVILMRQNATTPYFALWVANDDVLVPLQSTSGNE